MVGIAGALRDFLAVVLTTVGVYVLLFASFFGTFSVLFVLPEWAQAAVCRGLFFCWPGLLLFGVLAVALTVGLLSALASRGYLRVPDAW